MKKEPGIEVQALVGAKDADFLDFGDWGTIVAGRFLRVGEA